MSMAMALPALQIIGSVIGAIGALKQGEAASNAAQFNATVARQNADISRTNAAAQAAQQDRENYLRLSSIRAAQGKSGGMGDTGSVLDVIGDAAAQGELQKQDILYQGELQARGFQNTAALDEYGGKTAKESSYYKAGGELLKGGASAYGTMQRTK